MGRKVNRKKDVPKVRCVPKDEGAEACEEKQTKRGWSDVFDNLTYSDGPGDNIYVFG